MPNVLVYNNNIYFLAWQISKWFWKNFTMFSHLSLKSFFVCYKIWNLTYFSTLVAKLSWLYKDLKRKTMEDKLIYVPNYWLKSFDTTSFKVPKVFKPTNKRTCLLNFGHQFNLQSIVHSLPLVTIFFLLLSNTKLNLHFKSTKSFSKRKRRYK